MTDHLDMFVDEGVESISAMNNGLLALENDPTDEQGIDAVFRHAHTLKGNAAAIGLEEISSLAHVLEDVLDDVRDGSITIDEDLMDELFVAVDCIEAMLGELDQHGETQTDPTAVIERIETIEAGDETTQDTNQTPTSTGIEHAGTRASVSIGDGGMPGVDATFVLNALDAHFDAFELAPPRDTIEAGEFEQTFEVAIPGDAQSLETVLTDVSHVEEFELIENEPNPPANDTEASPERDSQVEQLSSVRVDIDRLVELNELVEQLVTSRIRIQREFDSADIESEASRDLEKVSQRLRDVAMEMRLVPFDTISRGFPRVVRDTARELGKDIEFSMDGTDVEVDRRLLTRLKDPLIHVIRNAVDHGIESAAEREAAGKPTAGRVEINVRRERDEVVVEVQDDGGGIDVETIRQRALEEDVATKNELAAMADDEIYNLLFHAGFSTATEVTDVSGRGVGMDVVRETVMDLDGTVSVDSTVGEGTAVRFRLPVTMAVADVMLIQSDGRLLGVPISDIEEVTTNDVIKEAHDQAMADRHGTLSPVVDLETEFDAALADGGAAEPDLTDKKLVVIREDKRDVALACDAVIGQEEVVVKPLSDPLAGTPGISGTAVLGDQQLVPIIDVVSI